MVAIPVLTIKIRVRRVAFAISKFVFIFYLYLVIVIKKVFRSGSNFDEAKIDRCCFILLHNYFKKLQNSHISLMALV